MLQSTLLLLHTTVFAPFAGFLIIVLLTFKNSFFSRIVSVSLMGLSALAAGLLLGSHFSLTTPLTYTTDWLVTAHLTLQVGYYLDRLSLLMLFLVSFISFLIQIFSLGYMDEDSGKSRFFAYLSFFSWAMMFFVVSTNLLQAYIFWELFGLASYLLIGFWYEKPQAVAAAKKSFVMTRFGDVGFLIGLILLLAHGGEKTIQYLFLNSPAVQDAFLPHFLTLIAVLIFFGMMGKSAQFPLHTWLPDAMEGPTPVSALIHSATMVAAGVYLFARLYIFYSFSPRALEFMLIIAAFTAFIGATLACVERDIKKILAYSTVSQLGLMMMSLAAGSYLGGVLHLSAHAFFKALLFLSAGFLIHKFHTHDLYEIAEQGGSKEKGLLAALAVGMLASSGIFPLSGFFSKDVIMTALLHSKPFFYAIASVVNFFTAFYSFKVLFVICLPKEIYPREGHLNPGSKQAMLVSISILAFISLIFGIAVTPLGKNFLIRFLTYGFAEPFHLQVALTSTLIAFLGAFLSFLDVKLSPWGKSAFLATEPAKTLLERKYFIDEFYGWGVRIFVLGLGKIADWFDRNVIDGAVNGVGYLTVSLGRLFSGFQSGFLQNYLQIAVWSLAGVILMITLFKQ
jgi:NADH-quinone oxidoreductase subunit L